MCGTLGTTMNELPKVLPVWTNAAEQGLADLKVFAVDSRLHPDYGGAGVDVSVDGRGDIQCTALKHHDAKSTRLCARNITLPFGLPNTVLSLQERCLQPQLDLNERIDFYEFSLLKDRPWARRQAPLGNCVRDMLEAVRIRKGKRPFENMKIHYGLQDLFEARPTSMQYRECNWGYTGGCLALVPATAGGGTTLLCHPCGVDLNSLAISELSQNEDPDGPLVLKTGTVVLQKPEGSEGPIFQVCTRRIEDGICCCIRLEDRCQYVRLYDSVGEDPMVLADFSYDDTLCFVMPSTYIMGELLSVTRAGTILLQNCEDREPTWQTTVSHEVENCDQWWCCDFGSHPRSVLFMDHVAVYALDARSSGARRRKLCSVERDPFLNDKFTLFRQNPVNLHQVYLASSVMLSLWDERYPMQPMLTWNHGLKYSPTFLDAVAAPCGQGDPCDLYLTLGSQRSREVAVFSVSQESTSLQPVSLLPPWHLSKPCDFSNQLEYQGCQVEATVAKRVTAPLIGACVVTCSGGNLSALQLTSENILVLGYKFAQGACASNIEAFLITTPDVSCHLTAFIRNASDPSLHLPNGKAALFRHLSLLPPCSVVCCEQIREMAFYVQCVCLRQRARLRGKLTRSKMVVVCLKRSSESGANQIIQNVRGVCQKITECSMLSALSRKILFFLMLLARKMRLKLSVGVFSITHDVPDEYQLPESTADVSFTGLPRGPNPEPKERAKVQPARPPVDAITILDDDDFHTGFSQEATDLGTVEARTSRHRVEADADWVVNEDDGFLSLAEAPVASEASRRPGRSGKQALKRKRAVSDGF
ncbi:unnamed protein product [Ixodes pacificus]